MFQNTVLDKNQEVYHVSSPVLGFMASGSDLLSVSCNVEVLQQPHDSFNHFFFNASVYCSGA